MAQIQPHPHSVVTAVSHSRQPSLTSVASGASIEQRQTSPSQGLLSSSSWGQGRQTIINASSGGNTELIVQIRMEREAGRTGVTMKSTREASIGSASAADAGEGRPATLSSSSSSVISGGASNSLHNASRLTSKSGGSACDSTALTSADTQQLSATSEHVSEAQSAKQQVDASYISNAQQFATSNAARRLSTGSAVLAAVRRLEEDARARDIAHQMFQATRTGSTASVGEPSATSAKEQEKRSVDADGISSATPFVEHPKIEQPPESFDQSFGLEALQAAFSAKYYELANKCKNWERYAAQLRARAEALEVENRVLRESNVSQQRQIGFLEAENSGLKDQSDMRELRAREVEQRLTFLEQRLSSQPYHTANLTSHSSSHFLPPPAPTSSLHTLVQSSASAASPSQNRCESRETINSLPEESDLTAFHSSNLLDVPEEQSFRPPTPLQQHQSHPLSTSAAKTAAVTGRVPQQRTRSSSHLQARRDSIVAQDAALREHSALNGEVTTMQMNSSTQREASYHVRHDSKSSDIISCFGSSGCTTIGHNCRYLAKKNAPDPAAPVLRSCTSFVRVRPSHGPRTATSPSRMVSMAGQKRPSTSKSTSAGGISSIAVFQQRQPHLLHSHELQTSTATSGILPKRRSNNSNAPEAMQSSASLSSLNLGPAGGAGNVSMASSRSFTNLEIQSAKVRGGSVLSETPTIIGTQTARTRSTSSNDQTILTLAAGDKDVSEVRHNHVVVEGSSSSHSSENLSDQTDCRRRLRRTSLNQQQQFAQIQAQREASGGYGTRPPSRSASRMSTVSNDGNAGGLQRQRCSSSNKVARSRAGSASVHDSIPAVKDDLFSEGNLSILEDIAISQSKAVSHSQSHPALGASTSLSSLAAPSLSASASNHVNVRRHLPLIPLNSLTNVDHLTHKVLGANQVASSQSDSAELADVKPTFQRTTSANSISGSSVVTSNSSHRAQSTSTVTSLSSAHISHSHQPSTLSSSGSQASMSRSAATHSGDGPALSLGALASVPYLLRGDSDDQGATEDDSLKGTKISQSSYDHSAKHLVVESTPPGSAENDSSLVREEDNKGAHRRLYEALRDELSAEHLTKFERYVHRYDALEIPIDGPRGLVNRVQHLLIKADPTLAERPADYRRRKKLAREFERIVRVDLGEATPVA